MLSTSLIFAFIAEIPLDKVAQTIGGIYDSYSRNFIYGIYIYIESDFLVDTNLDCYNNLVLHFILYRLSTIFG